MGGNGNFGAEIAAGKNVFGQAGSDIIVGAPLATSLFGAPLAGQIHIYEASSLTGTAISSSGVNVANDYYGSSIAIIGDFNNDSYYEYVVGAPRFSPANLPGHIIVHQGGFDTILLDRQGQNTNDSYGIAVANIGDINLDQQDDFLIGASGGNPFTVPQSLAGFAGNVEVFSTTTLPSTYTQALGGMNPAWPAISVTGTMLSSIASVQLSGAAGTAGWVAVCSELSPPVPVSTGAGSFLLYANPNLCPFIFPFSIGASGATVVPVPLPTVPTYAGGSVAISTAISLSTGLAIGNQVRYGLGY